MPNLLQEALASHSLLILDGAMGTELQRRGVDTGLPMWSANALLVHPEIVLQIHKDYISAGADIITTNTFRTTRRTMRRAHLPDRSKQITLSAVEIAKQAREAFPERRILIAGSMAPLEDCYRPDLVPPDQELIDEHTELAERLTEAGVDFILVETINSIREAYAACEAGRKTGKEVVVSFICNKEGNLLSGESLTLAVKTVADLQPTAFSINCVSPRYLKKALVILTSHIPACYESADQAGRQHPCLSGRQVTSQFSVAAYGNVGLPESNLYGWEFTHDVSEDQYALHAREWHRLGANIIGGCCGTTPGYIGTMAGVLGKTYTL